MDWGLLGFVLGGLTLAVTLIFGWLTFFKQFPKRSLTYEFSASPILNPLAAGLKVFLDGVEVKAPYVVNLQVTSRSRVDISSGAFDAGHPLVFDFGREVLGTPTPGASMRHELRASQVRFPPQLVRKRSTVSVLFVTEGAPRGIVVTNPLVDVDVTTSKPGLASNVYTRGIWLTLGASASMVGVSTFAALFFP